MFRSPTPGRGHQVARPPPLGSASSAGTKRPASTSERATAATRSSFGFNGPSPTLTFPPGFGSSSPWLPVAFNLLGSRMGRGVYLDTTDITEFDCVTIGDYSELNALACPQTHLFEDRIMKIDHVTIGRRVYMGPRSAVLYSAVVGDNAKLGALTLVMKGEFIPAATAWRGCPAAPARV